MMAGNVALAAGIVGAHAVEDRIPLAVGIFVAVFFVSLAVGIYLKYRG